MPPSEPTPTDVAAVAGAIGEPPAAPPTTPPAEPPVQTQQPAPPTDPFAQFTQPTPPAAEPPAQPPTEPPAPPPVPSPVDTPPAPSEPPTQTAQTLPTPEPTYQTYEEYMQSVLKDLPPDAAAPDPSKIDPDDPNAIKNFFDDLVNTAVTKAKAETQKSVAIQNTERRLWDESFDKYGTLRTNKPLRDMVHSIRMGFFQRGIAITPVQAADKLLDSLGSQYKQGVADSAVVSTIENVQPSGGGTGVPVPTTLDGEAALTAVQTGGETALADILDKEIKAGRL